MAITAVFDVETDGLLDYQLEPSSQLGEVTKVHSMVVRSLPYVWSGNDQPHSGCPLKATLNALGGADILVGHNIIAYDLPVLKKLYGFTPKPGAIIFDTLVACRLIWTNIKDIDFNRRNIPAHLYGSHSLEAWGYRIGVNKGQFGKTTNWQQWSQQMQDYCEQDTLVTEKLYEKILAMNYSKDALDLEMRFAQIMQLQEERGFGFDLQKATGLQQELTKKKLALEAGFAAKFPGRVVQMKKPAYWMIVPSGQKFPTKGAALKAGFPLPTPGPPKTKTIPFNPASRTQLARVLKEVHGWESPAKTEKGKPRIDETTLKTLHHPDAAAFIEYLTIEKRLGQLATGKEAWIKLERKGRIHGKVNTVGAVTGRCTHRNPNLAQVPKEGEYRELFVPTPGYVLVGCDAKGLELRCLSHYLAFYDGGAYGREVVNGDIHTMNQLAAGLATRDAAKTFIYAFTYGAGDEKLGSIAGVTIEEAREMKANRTKHWDNTVRYLKRRNMPTGWETVAKVIKGGDLRRSFLSKIPGLGDLIEAVQEKSQKTQWIKGIDGRLLFCRAKHSALNTLLQSAGAVVMKKALVLLYDTLIGRGWVYGRDFAFVANIHDEYQCEVLPGFVSLYRKLAVEAIRQAGQHFNFRCPLDGDSKEGQSWRVTH